MNPATAPIRRVAAGAGAQHGRPAAAGAQHHPRPRRGEVWFVRGSKRHAQGTEIWPNRFAVVVSPDTRNDRAGFVVVAYLRGTVGPSPMHVATGHGTVMTEQLFTVDKSRLGDRRGALTSEELRLVDAAIATTIGLHLDD